MEQSKRSRRSSYTAHKRWKLNRNHLKDSIIIIIGSPSWSTMTVLWCKSHLRYFSSRQADLVPEASFQLNRNYLKDSINGSNMNAACLRPENIIVKLFSEAATKCMNRHAVPTIERSPKWMILHCGTNEERSWATDVRCWDTWWWLEQQGTWNILILLNMSKYIFGFSFVVWRWFFFTLLSYTSTPVSRFRFIDLDPAAVLVPVVFFFYTYK